MKTFVVEALIDNYQTISNPIIVINIHHTLEGNCKSQLTLSNFTNVSSKYHIKKKVSPEYHMKRMLCKRNSFE